MLNTSLSKIPCKKWHAISLLCANDSYLLDFLFTANRDELNCSPEDLLCLSGDMSSEQQLLIRIALNIWSGTGEVSLTDILEKLDAYRFESFMLALEFYRYSRKPIPCPLDQP